MVKSIGKTDRRKFLKTTGVLAGAVALSSLSQPIKAVVFESNKPKDDEGPWYGIAIDLDKCIGCASCAKACKEENDVPKVPFYFRNWVEHYTILNDGEIKVESKNGGIDGFDQAAPKEDIFKSFFVPKMCNHCYKSPCTQVCPVGATFESPEGVVLIDQEYCIGCKYCVQACPYGCRYTHPTKHVADKCTFCYHRLKKGLNPACMEVCPTGARIYGNLRDKDSSIMKFLKNHDCMVLKPHLNTGSKLYYNHLSQEVR